MCEDANQGANVLTTKLSNILDVMAPVRTVQCRRNYRLNNADNNPKTLWKIMKGWLSWKTTGPPSQLFSEGTIVNSPAGLAEVMNKFFIEKVKQLRQGIPANDTDPFKTLKETMSERTCEFNFKAVDPDQVLKIIKSLKNSRSTGLDNIDTYIIKLVASDILPALTHVINLSISEGVFPCEWKKSKVVPLLKKGDSLDPRNYRPVALLPIFSKILERAVFVQLVEYLESNKLLHPNHHGSRGSHSTGSALLQMYDTWQQEVEEDNMVGVMMLDLSAAFDMVDHTLLLEKLQLHGLDTLALKWVNSYLVDRSQTVCIDGCLSPFLKIQCGVPQGSVLGPLMYILFTNDLPEVIHSQHDSQLSANSPNMHCPPCGSLVNYVDDGTYSFASRDPVVLSNTLTDKYNLIRNYMESNRLVINADKTHLVVMGKRKMDTARKEVHLLAGTHIIEPSVTQKLLGCHIHQNLKWKEHIQTNDKSLIRQLTSRLNALKKLAANAPFQTRLLAANAVFISVLTYLIPLWGGSENYLLKALQVAQNKAARCVTRLSWFTPTRQLLRQCGWLSIKQLAFYHTVLTVHRIMKSGKPVFLRSKLTTEFQYQTRQATDWQILWKEALQAEHKRTLIAFLTN